MVETLEWGGGKKLHKVGSVIMFHAVVIDLRHLNAFLLLGHHEVKSFLTCSHLCDIVSLPHGQGDRARDDRAGLLWTKTSKNVRQSKSFLFQTVSLRYCHNVKKLRQKIDTVKVRLLL